MPRWLVPAFLLLVVASFIPFAMIGFARASKSDVPRINLVPDMDYQPKFQAQDANPLFADGRAMRLPPEGTVARGDLRAEDPFWRGRAADDWVARIPATARDEFGTWEALLARGRERFDIYCAVCHGASGHGDGTVSRRATELMELGHANWVPPTSLHDETVLARPDGHLFNTITNGIRNMPAYGSQIAAADRWAIVGYVRALQRSQAASPDDVPESERAALR